MMWPLRIGGMSDRFFVETPIAGERASLVGPEAHHLAHVMRISAGTEITLFDGSGAEFAARVLKVGRAAVDVEVLDRHEVSRELTYPLVLGIALPKGDRQKWLLEKATELGVTRIVPLKTSRGVAQPVEQALERLRRGVIEASKQCGRNKLLEITSPQVLSEYVAAAPPAAVRWLAHPGGQGLPQQSIETNGVYLAIGPEGGFTDDEVVQAESQGWQTISLGPRILRVDTAALALCAWWL